MNQKPKRPLITDWKKGQWESIWTLKDNSKVFFNSLDIHEAERIWEIIRQLIDPQYLVGAFGKPGVRKGVEIKKITVKNTMAIYWSQGAKKNQPDWTVYL